MEIASGLVLKQFDLRDGVLVNAWPWASEECDNEVIDLLPHYTSERGYSALRDLQSYLRSGNDFTVHPYVYRVVKP